MFVTRQLNIPHLVVIVVKENHSECKKKKTSLRDPSSLSAGCQDRCWEARTRLHQVHFQNRRMFPQSWSVVGEERRNGNGNLPQQTPGSSHYGNSLCTEEESKTRLNSVFHFVLWWWEEWPAIVLGWVLTMVRCGRRERLLVAARGPGGPFN